MAIELEVDGEEKDTVICWINTSAWSEMLNVEVWVIKKSVLTCLLMLFEMLSLFYSCKKDCIKGKLTQHLQLLLWRRVKHG